MLRTILLLYAVLQIVFRVAIFHQTTNACGLEAAISDAPAEHFLEHSDHYDQRCIALEGKVAATGHLWWDVFFIRSFQLRTLDGQSIRVFTQEAIPPLGAQLVVSGTCRQFYSGAYFTWVGIVESSHSYVPLKRMLQPHGDT